MWVNAGILTPYPDKWVSTIALSNSPLIRVFWLKGNASLNQINKRFLIRRKFITGEVEQAIITYASDEPLIIHFQDLGEDYYIQIKKLMYWNRYPKLISEPFYQISVDYYQV